MPKNKLTVFSEMVVKFLRLSFLTLLIILAVGIIFEIGLRARSLQPQNLYRVGFSATVLDKWTGWAMRGGVGVNEYAVTNAYGLHEDREINLQKPQGLKRVLILGSSVVWGLGENLKNTIPRSAQRVLEESGCASEVLNGGGQGYNILNTNSFVITKAHQFNPDAIAIVMDMQMLFPQFPPTNPITDEKAVVKQLGYFEGLYKKVTEYSVVLTVMDNVWKRKDFLNLFNFPAKPKNWNPKDPQPAIKKGFLETKLSGIADDGIDLFNKGLNKLKQKDTGQSIAISPAPPLPKITPKRLTLSEYEEKRKRELGGLIASISAFSNKMNIPIYFITPYGPYFQVASDDLNKFSLNMLGEAKKLHGDLHKALKREVELSSAIVKNVAKEGNAHVLDMFPYTKKASMASGHFSTDGIHFSKDGYNHMGKVIANRLLKDGLCSNDSYVMRAE